MLIAFIKLNIFLHNIIILFSALKNKTIRSAIYFIKHLFTTVKNTLPISFGVGGKTKLKKNGSKLSVDKFIITKALC